MTKFLLIRHAVTDAVGKHLSGRTPGVTLNAEGVLQAVQLAAHLEGVQIDTVYSSPLERAMQTAEPIAESRGLEVKVNSIFSELDFGAWTGKSFTELADDEQFRRFNLFRSATRIPLGETMLEAQARMVRGIEKLAAAHDGKTIAIVSHADMIKSAVAYYAGIHLDMFQRIEISPASVSVIELYQDTARIAALNHLSEISF